MLALLSLVAFWALFGKYELLRGQLEDTRTLMTQGSLIQPSTESSVHISPDHVAGRQGTHLLSRTAPQLMDVHIDLATRTS